jgi:hypothetical protein
MTAKGERFSRVGGSDSEGDTNTTGNMKWMKPGRMQRLTMCHINVEPEQKPCITDDVNSVVL